MALGFCSIVDVPVLASLLDLFSSSATMTGETQPKIMGRNKIIVSANDFVFVEVFIVMWSGS
jgi:hypothetical protein